MDEVEYIQGKRRRLGGTWLTPPLTLQELVRTDNVVFFYNLSIELWNCSDSVIFHALHFISIKLRTRYLFITYI